MTHANHQILEHPRMLFFLGFIAFAIGIGSSNLDPNLWLSMAAVLPLVILLLGWWKKYYIILLMILLSIFWWHLWSREYANRELSNNELITITNGFSGSYRVSGKINRILYKNDFNTTYRLNIANIANKSTGKYIQISDPKIHISVDIPNNLTINIWDMIEYNWKINPLITFPLQWFSGYAWYNRIYGKSTVPTFKKIHTELPNTLEKMRDWSKSTIFKGFPEDISGVILGMTIGNIDLLSSDIKKSFTQAGITHILVVSWSNIAFVIIIITNLLKYLPITRIMQTSIIIVFVILYGTLVWWDMPVIRAVMMWLITYMAIEWWKKASSISILILVGFIILLYSPLTLVYDAGFGLSFMGTIGILLLYSPIEKLLSKINTPKFIKEIIWVSISASIWSLVAIIYYFWNISVFAIFANILICWLLWWILFSSIIYLIFSLIGWWLVYLWWWIVYLPTVYIVEIGNFFGKWYMYTIDEKYTSFVSLFLLWLMISILFYSQKNRLLESE